MEIHYIIIRDEILYDHINKGIQKPTLLIGGLVSIIPWQTIVYQQQFYCQSQVRIFTEEQGGSHNMFMENPFLFNDYLNCFLSSLSC